MTIALISGSAAVFKQTISLQRRASEKRKSIHPIITVQTKENEM